MAKIDDIMNEVALTGVADDRDLFQYHANKAIIDLFRLKVIDLIKSSKDKHNTAYVDAVLKLLETGKGKITSSTKEINDALGLDGNRESR